MNCAYRRYQTVAHEIVDQRGDTLITLNMRLLGSDRAEHIGKQVVARITAPTIVCLCGSTRFWRTFQEAGLRETLAGRIVLSIGAASGTDDTHFGNLPRADYDRVKAELDELHRRKIDLADEVLILDVDGYIGESTAGERAYAQALGKPIRYWSQEQPGGDA